MNYMKIVVIIPTYNEKDNTPKMIEFGSGFRIKPHEMNLLYIDGNSPDGTADVIRKYQKSTLIFVVETRKKDLGKPMPKA